MKINKARIYTIILGAALGLGACQDDLLETVPSNAASYEQAFSSPAAVEAALTGIYRLMRDAPLNSGSTPSHDSYGVPHFNLTWDVMGQDLMANAGWFVFQYELDNKLPTYRGTYMLWATNYNMITNANNIIANAPKVPGITEAQRTAFEAEAKALRAFGYFNLARTYQHTYLKNPEALAVPLVLEQTTINTEGKPRATLKQVYTQIVEDLTTAEKGLSTSRVSKSRVNKNVVQGLLARVYLEMGEWALAADYAVKARQGYSLMTPTQWKEGFNTYTSGEWIWGLAQSADQQVAFASFYSTMDGRYTVDSKGNRTYVRRGYNNIRANDKFVELFALTDARREFQEAVGTTNSNRYTVTKFKDLPDLSGDFVLMRSAEMILIEAEAKARLGEHDAAQQLVHTLRQQRFTVAADAVKPTTTDAALVDEIWVERRKELYGEGFGLMDIKRLQKPLVRTGNHTAVIGTTPANSDLFIYMFPQLETINNPNFGPQNP
ncbi:RagB/SusD family nutrient uptake outer membrane protein [Rufibacter glacialis]|uniref:RagB/SusD family nutrient uptake outer membrane protein n=1 Tax=Rufibacter glacialis TaxID=1259555 RepID=A0A5M8QGA9_9BACT|nr:RagB/SusD family nutrient uptake outer membrane protein [Rufibacter glacialis]KAA6434268.1 RagB/SusD family nutrient uptake outer membrane protein [Rufibacter glacialis]GGK68171.1 membrane protein [Rufibacter glacialis]